MGYVVGSWVEGGWEMLGVGSVVGGGAWGRGERNCEFFGGWV